jgi:hypothetical protein
VPIVLIALGNEAKVTFRLTYDTNLLNTPTAACGAASGPACTITFDATTPGVLDVTVTPAGGTFAAGMREVAVITFNTVANVQPNTPLTFAAAQGLTTDTENNPLQTTYTNGFVVFGQGTECDVAERFTGDGIFRSDDGDVMRQMIAGMAVNLAFNEFQRADCAPFSTKGDGVLDATDFQQIALTIANLIPQQTAGGFFVLQPAPPPFAEAESETSREMRIVSTTAGAGNRVTVAIDLDAQGDETAASFTLAFDAMKLRNPVVSPGRDVPAGTRLTANTDHATDGRVMMLIDSLGSISRSTIQMVSITFDVAPEAASGATELYFTSDPTGSAVSDKQARSLQTRFTSGTVTISGANAQGVRISGRVLTPEGPGLRNAQVILTDADGASRTIFTSSLGYYEFDGVKPGRTYRVAVTSKRFRFLHRTVEPTSDLAEVNFTAQE